MEPLPKPTGNRRPLWQFLLPPMLLISVGLHGLVLFTPVSPSEDDLVPPPDPEEDGIAITKIEAPTSRTTRPQTQTGTQKTQPASRSNRASQNTTSQNTSNRSRSSGQNRSNNRSTNNRAGRSTNSRNNNSQNNNRAGTGGDRNNSQANTSPIALSGKQRLEAYFETFASYRGVDKPTEAETTEKQTLWLRGLTEGEGAPYANNAEYANLQSTALNGIGKVPYEAKICLPEAPSDAQILVLVKADGSPDSDFLQQVQSTGYRAFDNVAQTIAKTHSYPSTGQPATYLINIPVDYNSNTCKWPPEDSQLPAAYLTLLDDYTGPDMTTPNDRKIAQATWLENLEAPEGVTLPATDELELQRLDNPNSTTDFDKQVQVEYPLNICLPIEPKTAVWGVIVQPDGSVKEGMELLRSTGYPSFNERAEELVKAYTFPAAETAQVAVIEIPVDYNDNLCQNPASDSFSGLPNVAASPGSDSDNTTSASSTAEDTDNSTATIAALDADRQTQLLAKGRENLGGDSSSNLNVDNPGFAAEIVQADWPAGIEQSCFISDFDATQGIIPAEGAEDAFLLTRNVDLAGDSLLSLYGTPTSEVGEYCGTPLLELKENGVLQLFASVVGIGAGNSSSLVVIWPADPR